MSVSGMGAFGFPARSRRSALVFAVAWIVAMLDVAEARAQDAVLEALREQRQRVRTAEVLLEIGLKQETYGPVHVPVDHHGYRRIVPQMPVVMAPRIEVPELDPRPPRAAVEVAEPPEIGEVRLVRVAPGEAGAFLDRYMESLWINVAGQATPLDTLATPVVRARLHSTFGPPTRTPVPRAGAVDEAVGSPQIQFEYWFVVNDSIPFVVMDRGGPFGRGLLMIGDESQAFAHGAIREHLIDRILVADRLMTYVDYYQDEDGQWFVTGYDGEEFYVRETARPRWARRSSAGERRYDFR